ncbi:MAG: hypothetical protein LUG91_01830 [Ruminococcus sp.]|nr:hypothetical protein [Ruminococcus sp.]
MCGVTLGNTTQRPPYLPVEQADGFAAHLLANFRHLSQNFFDIHQYACKIFAASDKNMGGASAQQSLCGVT